jgi:hypothetical protein
VYVLVVLTERPDVDGPPPEHEPFVDSLIERGLVLLGGTLGDVDAAYVLRCDTLDEARAVVAEDPLVSSGAFTPSIAPWDLVGVDLRLVDADLAIGEE